ncbi:MAG: D-alanyl-D-alanine carboxypeptidase family protein [Granulosicoccus sp.]
MASIVYQRIINRRQSGRFPMPFESQIPVYGLRRCQLACAVCLASCILLLCCWANPLAAAPIPAPPQLSANSFLLFDHDSGKVLASKDPDKRIEPASLTKMMTAYIVASALQRGNVTLDEPVLVSAEAQAMPGSRMFIEAGSVVPLQDLLRGLIIQSGNDASVALAEHIAATEPVFVDMMNRMAKSLGMTSTNFTNASGLPGDNHYTTASDLAIIASAIIREHPETYKLYSEREFTFNDITQKNRNSLLWRDESVDGMKTGHTQAAGYCLVASAVRENMRLVSIVLGSASESIRIAESQKLLNYGFRFFRTRQVYAAGEAVAQARLWMGETEQIELGVADNLYLTLPRDDFASLQSKIELNSYIRAPVIVGRELGRSVLMAGDRVVREVPLLALQTAEEGGIFTRMKHSIQRFFQ